VKTVNIHPSETHFSRLLDRAQEGQEFVIAKAGRPVARLGPLARPGKKCRLGLLDGKFRVPDDFDDLLPDEVIAAFQGWRRGGS
jgi:antitoxin (DNA-binding transcriptional repressor) of toxin-antitoxin stability system